MSFEVLSPKEPIPSDYQSVPSSGVCLRSRPITRLRTQPTGPEPTNKYIYLSPLGKYLDTVLLPHLFPSTNYLKSLFPSLLFVFCGDLEQPREPFLFDTHLQVLPLDPGVRNPVSLQSMT